MLRRDLLKALTAFVTAGTAVTAQPTSPALVGISGEPAFSGSRKLAFYAKSPPAAFTPPTAPAEPEPAVFALPSQDIDPFTLEEYDPADFVGASDYSPLPAIHASKIPPQVQALREALWEDDQLPVEVDIRGNSTRILFFCPESARRLGTDEHKQALARHAIATTTSAYARIYNGGAACEVTFRRIEA